VIDDEAWQTGKFDVFAHGNLLPGKESIQKALNEE
jgi:hypothetical protein